MFQNKRGVGHEIPHKVQLAQGLVQVNAHRDCASDAGDRLLRPGLIEVRKRQERQQERTGNGGIAEQLLSGGSARALRALRPRDAGFLRGGVRQHAPADGFLRLGCGLLFRDDGRVDGHAAARFLHNKSLQSGQYMSAPEGDMRGEGALKCLPA